ncbi:MAG: Na(+)/H(+) antiporter subunit B [Planctomycetota bacterium]
MSDQLVLRVITKMMIPFILVFGLYVITHGELGPGGGFQGGAILAAAVIVYSLMFGVEAGKRLVPPRALDTCMVCGVGLFIGVGAYAAATGYVFLDYTALQPAHPAHAEPWGMTLVEYGVGMTVASVMVTIFNKIADQRKDGDVGHV